MSARSILRSASRSGPSMLIPLAMSANLLIAADVSSASGCADTPITQWSTAAGGNGHFYQGVCAPLTWEQAKTAAEARGGYLATSTSSAENSFVFGVIDRPDLWNDDDDLSLGPWLGAKQTDPCGSEPAGCWTWVTGEPWSFTSWAPGQPDNYTGVAPNELYAHFFDDDFPNRTAEWNDREDGATGTYVVEWDADPTSPIARTATLKCKNAKKSTAALTWDDPSGNPVGSDKLSCRAKKKTTQTLEQPRNADGYTLNMKTKNEEGDKQKCSDTESFTAGQSEPIAQKCKEKPAKAKFTLV